MIPRAGKLLTINWHNGDFPTLPGLARKILSLQARDDVEMAELEEIIVQEPALTMKILQMANSAFFNLRVEITSVRHAVTMLGMETVMRLVISAVMSGRFMTVPRKLEGLAKRLYRHCVATAIFATELEFELDEPDPYTLGLLHDIGWLPLMAQAPALFVSMFEDINLSRRELEGAWGVDHQLWGAKMAEIWELPAPFLTVAYRHHQPLLETAPPRYLVMVAVAHHLADAAGQSLFLRDIEPVEPEILALAGLDEATFADMETAAIRDRNRIETVCNLMLG